jgi:ArsR family transcriptional regulator
MGDLEKLTEVFKALSDLTRLRLVKTLSDRVSMKGGSDECGAGPLCVNAITHKLGISQSAVSQHLRILKQAGLVRGERRGSFVHYSLDPEGLRHYKTILSKSLGDVF